MADRITTSLAEAKILVMEGQAGYSPQIEVLDIAGGHQIRITTKVSDTQYQTDVFNVMDGEALDSDAIAQAVADYLSTHPISAPVTSVNGKTGEVDLDADNVGAATSQVSISGNVITIEDTARGTIAAYAITPARIGAGTYSKPSDGIPKTDLASDVQDVLDSAITTSTFGNYLDNEDKTVFTLLVSGTTVTLNTAFINAYYAYASARDAVFAILIGGTAESPDTLFLRPTRFNATAWSITLFGEHNGNRYSTTLTAASATASPMTGTLTVEPLVELPAVTASDNGKFLRVVNGVWSVQAVPSAEGASF